MPTTDNTRRHNSVEHLNQAHLARRWKMSQRTLERWRWRGEGPPFIKIGGRVVYRLEDIEAFETEQRRASTSDKPDVQPNLPGQVMPARAGQMPSSVAKRAAKGGKE